MRGDVQAQVLSHLTDIQAGGLLRRPRGSPSASLDAQIRQPFKFYNMMQGCQIKIHTRTTDRNFFTDGSATSVDKEPIAKILEPIYTHPVSIYGLK